MPAKPRDIIRDGKLLGQVVRDPGNGRFRYRPDGERRWSVTGYDTRAEAADAMASGWPVGKYPHES